MIISSDIFCFNFQVLLPVCNFFHLNAGLGLQFIKNLIGMFCFMEILYNLRKIHAIRMVLIISF